MVWACIFTHMQKVVDVPIHSGYISLIRRINLITAGRFCPSKSPLDFSGLFFFSKKVEITLDMIVNVFYVTRVITGNLTVFVSASACNPSFGQGYAHQPRGEKAMKNKNTSANTRPVADENGNINCTNCVNCVNCADCLNCKNCTDCEDCIDCKHCTDCEDCKDCKHCKDCKNCTDCLSCYDCTNCYNCDACDACDDCQECIGCANCDNCRNCGDCESCKACGADRTPDDDEVGAE